MMRLLIHCQGVSWAYKFPALVVAKPHSRLGAIVFLGPFHSISGDHQRPCWTAVRVIERGSFLLQLDVKETAGTPGSGVCPLLDIVVDYPVPRVWFGNHKC